MSIVPDAGNFVITSFSTDYSNLKFDTEKSPVYQGFIKYFPRAIECLANISKYGANKYNNGEFPTKWDQIPNGELRIADAEVRHMLEEAKGNIIDKESGHLHLAHEVWNAIAYLELTLRKMEKQTLNENKSKEISDR